MEEIRRLKDILEPLGQTSSIACLGAEKADLDEKISMVEDQLRNNLHDVDELELLSSLGIARLSRHIHEKRLSVTCWPEILCIQLCRLGFDVKTSRPIKDRTHIAFDSTLKLGSLGSDPNTCYSLVAIIEHHGGAVQGKKKTCIKYLLHIFQKMNNCFNSRLGHYTAYVAVTQKNGDLCWFHISDEVVIPVSLNDVLKAKAYLLFYKKS
jgi:ubiquitin C-terminal hydrolase